MDDNAQVCKQELNEIIQHIATTPTVYTYGDRWLYKMSEDVVGSPEDKKIASMVWIIGRSYAASPERIKRLKAQNEKPEVLFEKLAKRINEKIFEDNKCFFDRELTYTAKESIDGYSSGKEPEEQKRTTKRPRKRL